MMRAGLCAAAIVVVFSQARAHYRQQATPIPGRRYWPVSLDSLATGRVPHTHVQTVGRVRLVRREADGDIHVKLTGVRGFIVLELIPGLPVPRPAVGQRIRAFGIQRPDPEHGNWIELHPCERWEPVP